LLVGTPLVDATAPEFSLFMPQEAEPVGPRHHLAPVNIIESKTDALDFTLDVPPKEGLHPLQVPWEQPKLEFRVYILGDDLSFLAEFKNDGFSVANDGNAIITLSGKPPDQGAVAVWDIGGFEAGSGEL